MRSPLVEDPRCFPIPVLITSYNNNVFTAKFVLDNLPVADYCAARLRFVQ